MKGKAAKEQEDMGYKNQIKVNWFFETINNEPKRP